MTLGLVDKTIATRWEYDTATGQYVDQSGRLVVSASDLRDMVDSLVEGVRKEANDLTRSLAQQKLTLDEWTKRMVALIAALHTAASMVATGGMKIQAVIDDLDRTIKLHKTYLFNFANDIRPLLLAGVGAAIIGGMKTSLDNLAPIWALRAGSYADAGLITYERHAYLLHRSLNYVEARRVLKPGAEHCDGCEAQAARGWVPIDEFVPLGTEECGQWCKCYADYRITSHDVLIESR